MTDLENPKAPAPDAPQASPPVRKAVIPKHSNIVEVPPEKYGIATGFVVAPPAHLRKPSK